MRIKRTEVPFDGRPVEFFEDTETGKLYSRIFGGFAWPSEKPGFATVVAEEMIAHPSQIGKTQRLYVLDEYETFEPPRLIEQCTQLQQEYLIQAFYGRTTVPQQMELLTRWNRARRDEHLSELNISSAPHSDDGKIFFHVNLLRMRLDPSTMNLFGIAEKRLSSSLESFQNEDLYKATEVEFPAVASLGYAVAALDSNPFDLTGPTFTSAQYEYDLFNHSARTEYNLFNTRN
jgi:hypothetical protein